MACSCTTNTEINSANGYVIKKVKPFDICPLCAAKHLDYALIKYDTNIHRSIANIYLAYKHLNKCFNEEAELIFSLITKYFAKTLKYADIEECTNTIHNTTSQYIDQNITFEEKENLKLEETLTDYEKIYINFIAVNELYNFEVGYKDINTPYCIGLLQDASEYATYEFVQAEIRNIWKAIEENTKLSSKEVLDFAEDMLYRQEKDKNL